jgi:septal ring factor EnvC (AmiA/AmiB activator)
MRRSKTIQLFPRNTSSLLHPTLEPMMVSKISTRLTQFESDIKNVTRTMATIEKSNSQHHNKVDELQKKLADIQKRLSKLESNKN